MTEEIIYKQLIHILSEISEDEYPETYEAIEMNLDQEEKTVYDTAYGIACDLHNADITEHFFAPSAPLKVFLQYIRLVLQL